MRAGEPDAAQAVDLVHRAEEGAEPRLPRRVGDRQVAAVGVHVLAQERHLDHTLARQALDLGKDVSERP
jgi:hypothetical protein